MKKKYLLLLLLIVPAIVFADTKVINGNDFDVYKRSKEDIMNKWNSIGLIDDSVTKYVSNPSYTSPYKAGVLTQDYLNQVNDNLNYYRYLVGVPLTTKAPSNTEDLQTAEVIQTKNIEAGNNLTHTLYSDFTKPSDMTDEFWNKGAYASNNIVSYVYNRKMNPNFDFFDESIFGEEKTAGHRTALLNPELAYMEYGIGDTVVYGRENLDTEQYNKMTNSFAAYPCPGYFPKQDLASTSDWDVYLNINDFSFLSKTEEENVEVNIISRIQGVIDTRSVKNGNLVFEKSYGSYYRILIQRPTQITSYYESDYLVQITNLKDKDGNYVNLVYEINFFDKFEGIDGDIVDFTFDLNLAQLHLDGDYDERFVRNALSDVGIQIYVDTGAVIYDKVKRFDIRNIDTNKYQAFAEVTLPSYAKDSYNLLDQYSYIDVINYPEEYHYVYNDMEYNTKVGEEEIKMSLKSFTPNTYPNASGEATGSFFWVFDNGEEITFLNPSDRYEINGGYLTIKNPTKSDEGKYYAGVFLLVPYYYNNQTIYASDYYFSKPLTLTVEGMLGDMDQNGKIGLPDIIKLLKLYLGVEELNDSDLNIGDMDQNGKLGLPDIIMLLKIYLGIN